MQNSNNSNSSSSESSSSSNDEQNDKRSLFNPNKVVVEYSSSLLNQLNELSEEEKKNTTYFFIVEIIKDKITIFQIEHCILSNGDHKHEGVLETLYTLFTVSLLENDQHIHLIYGSLNETFFQIHKRFKNQS